MSNLKVIEAIEHKKGEILESLNNREILRFEVKDLEFEGNRITYQALPLDHTAMNKVMNLFRIKKDFLGFEQKMSKEDFVLIGAKLKEILSDQKIYAQKRNNPNGGGTISDIFFDNPQKAENEGLDYDFYFNALYNSLHESKKDFELKNFYFNPEKNSVNITLLDNASTFDVFGSGGDIWKTGMSVNFDMLQFNLHPFLERLVCSNGARTQEHGFGANIQHQKFNREKIIAQLNAHLVEGGKLQNDMVCKAARHLANNNISLNEFYNARQYFIGEDKKAAKHPEIIERFFDDTKFYAAYGVDIKEQSPKWKTTADSGINAYDFFNTLTWIGSHPTESGLYNPADRMKLQIQASGLFFKKKLDLEDVAPKPKFDLATVKY